MHNYIIIILLVALGVFIKNIKLLPENFSAGLNRLLIYFFIPILTLLHLPEIEIKNEYIWLLITPWLVYLGAIIFFYVVHKIKPIDNASRASLIMTSGIGSISFVGFPLFELFYGKQGLSYGIILSLGGTFVVCNTIGVATGFWFKNSSTNLISKLKAMVLFPPFLAMLLSTILIAFDYQHNETVKITLAKLSAPFTVLALFAIGLQINPKGFLVHKKYFLLGQLYKLVLAPLLIFLVFYFIGEEQTLIAKICILGAGIGSMYTIAIVASELKLNSALALLMPGLGIPISIGSIFIIYYLIT